MTWKNENEEPFLARVPLRSEAPPLGNPRLSDTMLPEMAATIP